MPGGGVPENVTVPEGLALYDKSLFATTTPQTSGTPTVPVRGRQARIIVVRVWTVTVGEGGEVTVSGEDALSETFSSKL
jgi:hypothetical protein